MIPYDDRQLLLNPNPRMPDAYKKPYAYAQYKERYGSASSTTGHEDHSSHEYDAAPAAH